MSESIKLESVRSGGPTAIQNLWKTVFEKYDVNGKGSINLKRFTNILTKCNDNLQTGMRKEVIEDILARAVGGNTDYMTYDEFLAIVSDHEPTAETPQMRRLVRYAAMVEVPEPHFRVAVVHRIQKLGQAVPPMFMLSMVMLEVAAYTYFHYLAFIPNNYTAFIFDPFCPQQSWRLVTYMLLHGDKSHLFGNIVLQLVLGIPLEMTHKWWRVAIVYMVGIIGGSLCSFALNPRVLLTGASAGVYAILMAHVANVVLNFKEMSYVWLKIGPIVVLVTIDIVNTILSWENRSELMTRISLLAHFGGAAVGLLIAISCFKNLKVRRWEVVLNWSAMTLLVLFLASMAYFSFYNAEKKYCEPIFWLPETYSKKKALR